MSTLALEGVSVRLGGRAVLQELSCALAAGEMLGIIGPNGAGKSTLLRVMAGLLRPDAGQVRLQGRELQSWPAAERARRIGYLPQAAPVHWPLDVRTVVELGRLPWRHGKDHADIGGVNLLFERNANSPREAPLAQALPEGRRETVSGIGKDTAEANTGGTDPIDLSERDLVLGPVRP